MASFKAMSCHVPAGTGENHKKPVRIATVQAEICIMYLLSTCKVCYCLSQPSYTMYFLKDISFHLRNIVVAPTNPMCSAYYAHLI